MQAVAIGGIVIRVKIESRQLALEPGFVADAEAAAPTRKVLGAYFTPDPVVATLVRWAIRLPSDRMLDPSCGDGRFIAAHRNSVGIECDARSASTAMQRAPWALVHEGDFFTWAGETQERFDCSAGNPPFVRYQTFKGTVRERALAVCRSLGVKFSGLTSSWAPFLVATAGLLKSGGRMAFVVPAEIGHAPYAAPLLDYLVEHFDHVQLVAIRRKLFPDLSEDCWLLYTDGFGGRSTGIHFTAIEALEPGGWSSPPPPSCMVALDEWRSVWKRRLRPFLLSSHARELYRQVSEMSGASRFGDLARIGIGYVSGDNEFFHLRPSTAELWGIPPALLQPAVRNGRVLTGPQLTPGMVELWQKNDQPVMLLRLEPSSAVPAIVQRYLDSAAGLEAREAYKCRSRDPWYSVPDVRIPDYFLTYMSGRSTSLVLNTAAATCTNSVHGLRVVDELGMRHAVEEWDSPFLALSRELEGHPLGGGMLKLEVREAAQILLPPATMMRELDNRTVAEALVTMRHWRHDA